MNKISNYRFTNQIFSITTSVQFCIFICLLLAKSSIVQATENGRMPYKNINKMLTIINEHAKSPYTGLIASLTSDNAQFDMSTVELSIVFNGKQIEKVFADKRGFVQFPLLKQDVGNNAEVVINQPKGTISMKLTAGVKPIQSLQVPYDELFGVLDDLETVASELVGLPSWMLPDVDYLEFYFQSASTINLLGVNINEFYQSNAENIIKIERDSELYKQKAKLIFSGLPMEVKFLH